MSDLPDSPTNSDSPPAVSSEHKPADRSDEAKEIFTRLGPAGILAVISMSLPVIGMWLLIGTMNRIGPWLQQQGSAGVVLYVIAFAVLAGLALLPTWVQSVLGGWAFKHTLGSVAAVMGYSGAAIIGYFIARRASGDRVVDMIEEKPKWRAVYDTLLRSGFGKTLLIVTLIRVPPNSPFALTNLVLSATRVPPLAYILGTVIGMAPRTIVAACIGANLSELDLANTRQTWVVVGGIFLAIIVVAIIGYMANQAVARVTTNSSAGSTDSQEASN
jgi:uncharacterized membrane protein YdjX (TVP38/TMEM64 family)